MGLLFPFSLFFFCFPKFPLKLFFQTVLYPELAYTRLILKVTRRKDQRSHNQGSPPPLRAKTRSFISLNLLLVIIEKTTSRCPKRRRLASSSGNPTRTPKKSWRLVIVFPLMGTMGTVFKVNNSPSLQAWLNDVNDSGDHHKIFLLDLVSQCYFQKRYTDEQ